MGFSDDIMRLRYSWVREDGSTENWEDISERVVDAVYSVLPKYPNEFSNWSDVIYKTKKIISERKFIPGGRFLAQAGKDYHQTQNCFLLRADDTREGWGDLLNKATVMLMSGGGIGVDYSALRPSGASLKRSGGTSSGAIPLMKVVNEVARGVMSGGKRRSAVYASLNWKSKDIFDFITIKNYSEEVKKLKEKDFDFPAPMDMTNISVILDKEFFDAFDNKENPMHEHAQKVYWMTVEQMVKTSEPGFQVDYDNPRESLRNA